jgi:uncharacterized protein (DUF433 family)
MKTMERRKAIDVRNRPAYSIGEAANYLRMSPATLQSWALGRTYPTVSGEKFCEPIFVIADKPNRRLSFVNLVEANTLAAMRRDYRLKMPNIRAALEYVSDQFGVKRPLCDQQFETNMADLFVERFGELVNVSKKGQVEMGEMLRAALRRVERDNRGIPIRLFPAAAHSVERSPYVAFDPTIAFGRPIIIGSGVQVDIVYERFEAGESTDELATDYGVERAAIEEAIRQAGHFRRAA